MHSTNGAVLHLLLLQLRHYTSSLHLLLCKIEEVLLMYLAAPIAIGATINLLLCHSLVLFIILLCSNTLCHSKDYLTTGTSLFKPFNLYTPKECESLPFLSTSMIRASSLVW